MNHFLYKLAPPRPSFLADMTAAEAVVMGEHVAYWTDLVAGPAIVFGPVADPSGGYGIAVVEATDEADVRALGRQDPAVTSGLATFEVYAMPGVVSRGQQPG